MRRKNELFIPKVQKFNFMKNNNPQTQVRTIKSGQNLIQTAEK